MKLTINHERNEDKMHIFEYIYGMSFKEASRQLEFMGESMKKLAFHVEELQKTFAKP